MWKYTTGTDERLPGCRDTISAICGPLNEVVVTGSGTFVTTSRISAEQKATIEMYLGRKLWERELIILPRFQ